MTTLAANKQRAFEQGDINEFPMIASDIIFEGAAVGLVDASGHARPLDSADRFVGFATAKADNASGSAADIRVQVRKKGTIELSVTGAVITDVGQPIYATDDDLFQFVATSAVFIGFIRRFVSAGVAVVEYDAGKLTDPHLGFIHETTAIDKTVDDLDNGKCFWFTADAKKLLVPAIGDGVHNIRMVNAGAFGTQLMSIDMVDATDDLESADITPADGKGLLNTKSTARRGDRLDVSMVDATGYSAENKVGIWAIEA